MPRDGDFLPLGDPLIERIVGVVASARSTPDGFCGQAGQPNCLVLVLPHARTTAARLARA
jgi:hypothetical protein